MCLFCERFKALILALQSSKFNLSRRKRSWEVWDCQVGTYVAGKGPLAGPCCLRELLSHSGVSSEVSLKQLQWWLIELLLPPAILRQLFFSSWPGLCKFLAEHNHSSALRPASQYLHASMQNELSPTLGSKCQGCSLMMGASWSGVGGSYDGQVVNGLAGGGGDNTGTGDDTGSGVDIARSLATSASDQTGVGTRLNRSLVECRWVKTTADRVRQGLLVAPPPPRLQSQYKPPDPSSSSDGCMSLSVCHLLLSAVSQQQAVAAPQLGVSSSSVALTLDKTIQGALRAQVQQLLGIPYLNNNPEWAWKQADVLYLGILRNPDIMYLDLYSEDLGTQKTHIDVDPLPLRNIRFMQELVLHNFASNVVGVISIWELNAVDTKLLSAPYRNKIDDHMLDCLEGTYMSRVGGLDVLLGEITCRRATHGYRVVDLCIGDSIEGVVEMVSEW
ncbi:hypothetical protein Tco_1209221 [Tanacetum coccineum]